MPLIKRLSVVLFLFCVGSIFLPWQWSEPLDVARHETFAAYVQLKHHLFGRTNATRLKKAHETPLPSWAHDQINEDFKPATPFSGTDVTKVMAGFSEKELKDDKLLVRLIVDKKGVRTLPESVNGFDGRRRALVEAFTDLKKAGLIHHFDGILCLTDAPPQMQASVPILLFSKRKEEASKTPLILIPDGINLNRWPILSEKLALSRSHIPFSKRLSIVYWRGNNTNPEREDAVRKFDTSPYDIKFSGGPFGNFISPVYQVAYKYHLSLDGVTAPWPGFVWKLASGSVVIRQNSPYIQWFYKGVQPHIHYAPTKEDLSDLLTVFETLENNPQQAQKLTQNAHQFSAENLTYEQMLLYLKAVVDQYNTFYQAS